MTSMEATRMGTKHRTLREIVQRNKVLSGGIGAERKRVLAEFGAPFDRILARLDAGTWTHGRTHYERVRDGEVRNEHLAGTIPTTPGVPRRGRGGMLTAV